MSGETCPLPRLGVPQDGSIDSLRIAGARDPDTAQAGSTASFIVPPSRPSQGSPDPTENYKTTHSPHPPNAAGFRAARILDTPPLTAAATPGAQAGPGLGGAEGSPEPRPRLSPQGPRPPHTRAPGPYPPARRGAAAPARGPRGGGLPGVVSWRPARPWRRRTACRSSGRACAPTRCGSGPRALRAGGIWSAPGPGRGRVGPFPASPSAPGRPGPALAWLIRFSWASPQVFEGIKLDLFASPSPIL